jgi:hypothetical protein
MPDRPETETESDPERGARVTSTAALRVASIVFVGLALAVSIVIALRSEGWIGGQGIGATGATPSASSSVIEAAQADPLPVVGPTQSPDPLAEEEIVVRDPRILVAVPASVPSGAPFVADPGLDDTSTTALGYRFDDAGLNRAALAAVLARKFGIEGRPMRTEDGGWTVMPEGGWLPQVKVDPGPMAAWSFTWLPVASTASPSTAAPSTVSPSTAAPSTVVPSAQPQIASPSPGVLTSSESPAPSVDQPSAQAVARAFLGDLGVPVDQLDWQVEVIDRNTVVTGWQVIADQRTQAAWRLAFNPAGQMIEATGFAATPVEVVDLPVLGAASALARARQSQWSALGPTLLAPATKTSSAPATVQPSPGTLPDRLIVSAELALGQFTQPDGRVLVLPSYVLTAADGSTWSLVAVADQALYLVRP